MLARNHDEILVFTEHDGDANATQRQVFYNATDATMDLELGTDRWVYLAERDRIARCSGIRTAMNTGTSKKLSSRCKPRLSIRTTGWKGLAWHPDGDLVFGLGENFGKPWTLTGTDGAAIRGTGEGGVFRCTADGRNLRRIARGFWNPFGICVVTEKFLPPITIPGKAAMSPVAHCGRRRLRLPAVFKKVLKAHHPFVAWNGELRGTLPMIHPTGEAPCGILPLGRGLLVPSWSDHRIDFFLLQRKGASFAADRMALVHGSRYFRPGCIASANGPEGGNERMRTWYLTDWVDGQYEAHGFGRLWKLTIDLDKADWTGTPDPDPISEQGQLASELTRGTITKDRHSLLQLAKHEDPFLAQLHCWHCLVKQLHGSPEIVAGWPVAERIQAVQALKLASTDPEVWVRLFLTNDDSEVQFETLRWIADAGLNRSCRMWRRC